jgi:hypothetical protein
MSILDLVRIRKSRPAFRGDNKGLIAAHSAVMARIKTSHELGLRHVSAEPSHSTAPEPKSLRNWPALDRVQLS